MKPLFTIENQDSPYLRLPSTNTIIENPEADEDDFPTVQTVKVEQGSCLKEAIMDAVHKSSKLSFLSNNKPNFISFIVPSKQASCDFLGLRMPNHKLYSKMALFLHRNNE